MLKYRMLMVSVLGIALLGILRAMTEQAVGDQVTHYHMQLSRFMVVALLDGHVAFPLSNIIKDTSDFDHPLLHPQLSHQTIDIPINVFLIDTGSRIILVDVGLAGLYNSASGNLISVLRQAGYQPEQITDILITHAHPDHVAGLLTAQGIKTFKNAELYIAEHDVQYWVHEQQLYPDLIDLIQNLIQPYRLHMFKPEQQLFEGVTVVAAPGHSPGHSGFLFESEGKKLLLWGDIVHIQAIQFDNPNIGLEDDTDMRQAIAARNALFARAARESLLIGGAHLDFPGLGNVHAAQGANDKAYSWQPLRNL